MPIYALGEAVPDIHPEAFVHPDAVVIGNVTVGALSSIWPGAVLRGDEGDIRIGARTSIQDGCVLHTTPQDPTVVGDDCVVGHIVHLEGCTIDNFCLIGNGSILMHRVHVQSGSVVAANSVLLDDTVVPPGSLALGSPATIREGKANPEMIRRGVDAYVRRATQYPLELRRID